MRPEQALTIQDARDWYPTDDPVHGFAHVRRVLALAEQIAQAEGADLALVQAAVLLHDAEDPHPPAGEADLGREGHHLASAAFARRVLLGKHWDEARIDAVQHAIRAHRFRDDREQPATLEAQVLFDADKLDAIGAIGVARAIAYAARADQPAYATPSGGFISNGQYAPDEVHSAYHEYIFKLSKLKDRLYTPTARRLGAERHARMSAFFESLKAELGEA